MKLKVVNRNGVKGAVFEPKYPCGGCTVCCEVMAVQELKKPLYNKCEYTGQGCCSIYKDRPQSCKDWTCGYSMGILGGNENYRPDNCGVMVNFSKDGPFPPGMGETLVIELFEAREGAFKELFADGGQRMNYLLQKIRSNSKHPLPIVRHYPYGSKIALSFSADLEKYPNAPAPEEDMSEYANVQSGECEYKQFFLRAVPHEAAA